MFGGYRSYIDRTDGNETAKRDDRKIIACKIEQLKKERNYILWEKTGKSVFCAGFPVFLLYVFSAKYLILTDMFKN